VFFKEIPIETGLKTIFFCRIYKKSQNFSLLFAVQQLYNDFGTWIRQKLPYKVQKISIR